MIISWAGPITARIPPSPGAFGVTAAGTGRRPAAHPGTDRWRNVSGEPAVFAFVLVGSRDESEH